MHTDGASHLIVLSVRSCCSSSTTNAHRAAEVCGWSVRLTSCEGDTQAASRREAGRHAHARRRRESSPRAQRAVVLLEQHDQPQNLRALHLVGYFSVTFQMEARWRRDGGETEVRRRQAESELEANWRRDAGGSDTADADEVEARWQMEARDGGEMEARWRRDEGRDGGRGHRTAATRASGDDEGKAAAAATRVAATRVARVVMRWRSRRPTSHPAGRSTVSRARWRQQAGRERRLKQVTEGVARAVREAEQPRGAQTP